MEAVKNRLTSLGGDAWTLIVDADQDFVADPGYGDFDQAIRRREAHGVVEDCIERARQPVRLAHDDGAVLAWPGEGDARTARFAALLPAVDQLLDQRADVDRS